MRAMAIFYAYIGLILCTCFPIAFGCRVDQHQDWAVKRLTILGRNYSLPCQALSGGFTESELLKFRSLKAFLFQNDERELLSDWLQYHANLHIVDHLNICQLLTLFSPAVQKWLHLKEVSRVRTRSWAKLCEKNHHPFLSQWMRMSLLLL